MSKQNSRKEIEEAHKKVRGEAKVENKPKKEADLEDIARISQPQPLSEEMHDSQYLKEPSHKPMMEIYNEIKDIYKAVEDKGYLSPVQQKQIEYFNSLVEKKIEGEEQGTYSFSEQAARAASVFQHLSASMTGTGTYKGKKSNEMYRS